MSESQDTAGMFIVPGAIRMYKLVFLSAFAALSGLTSSLAYGQALQFHRTSIPGIVDYTTGDGFVQALGVKSRYVSAYRGSDDYGFELALEGAIQWRRRSNVFFIENLDLNGIELGWRRLVQPRWFVQSGFKHETVLPSSKTRQGGLDEFPHRGSHVFGFFEFRRSFDDQWRDWVSGRISAGPSDFGVRAEIAYGHQLTLRSHGSTAEIELFLTFGDKEQVNNYFGISETDAIASGLSPIDLDGGYRSSGIDVTYRIPVFRDVLLIVGGHLEYYSSEIRDSSLVNDASETSADASLIYRF